MTRHTPVAVTGVGCLSAAGLDFPSCMVGLFSGRRAPAPPQSFTSSHPVTYPVFEVPVEFPEQRGVGKPDVLRTGRLALVAAAEALADAGLGRQELRGLRVGVCIGTTVGSAMNNEPFYRQFKRGERPPIEPIVKFLNSNPAASVAREYQLDGPCQTVVNACSSGTDAIGLAASWIRAGICDVALAGGADELCRVTYNGFISLLITDEQPCRPFDRERRGLNLGAGAALLVLESEAVRSRRGRRARASVLGYGSASDGYHLTAPRPDGAGLKRAIAEALAASGRSADQIAFVNAHGTATPDNDRTESRVLAEVLPGVHFVSTKGYTGHTLGAAGAIEAAFTIGCLEQQRIPANVGFATPDPELPAAPVAAETPIAGDVALSESLAFGGNNAVVILGREP